MAIGEIFIFLLVCEPGLLCRLLRCCRHFSTDYIQQICAVRVVNLQVFLDTPGIIVPGKLKR